MPKPLSSTEVESALADLPGWSLQNAKLHREYVFPEFAHAIGFLVMAAPKIEKMDHHPEWSNVYNKVTVDLTSHSAGGVTANDVELAKVLEGLAVKLQ